MGRKLYFLIALAALASASIPASAIENSVDASRQRRSLKIAATIPAIKAAKIPLLKKIPIAAKAHFAKIPVIGSLFGLHATPEIPHLGTYPLWKVHRYHGISLQPVRYPGERIPSNLPIPPYHHGEAPSIVNVPDPNYYPVDAPSPPANEYGVPHHEYGVPHQEHVELHHEHVEPHHEYGVPHEYVAPHSEYGVPHHEYGTPHEYIVPHSSPDHSPSGPYLPAHSPRGYASSSHASAASFSTSGSSSAAFSGASSSGGQFDLSTLQALLPPEMFAKVQVYASTPGGLERINALLGLANNARKLKSNAASSIQGMFQRLFGGAGGSTDVALNSGTWTNVPEVYPAHQGILNQFRAVGTGISGSLLPTLPEVPPLPKIPGLQDLPSAPELPHINLPDITPLTSNDLGGSYVSVQLPKAHQPEEAVYAPAHEYGPPAHEYSPPAHDHSISAHEYSPPAHEHGPPAHEYGPPAHEHSLPAHEHSSPTHEYSSPSQQYSPPSPQYSPPASQYSHSALQYSPPAPQYSPPAPQYSPPAPQYSPPSQYSAPTPQHSVAEIPSTSYGTPVGPVYSYPQSSGSSSSTFFQAPQPTYGTPDVSFAASENQEQYEGRNSNNNSDNNSGEAEEDDEPVDSQPPAPLKTTKLQKVEESRPLRGNALKAYLESHRRFKPNKDQKKETGNEVNEDS